MQRALLSLGLAWHGRVGLQTLWGVPKTFNSDINCFCSCTCDCGQEAARSLSRDSDTTATATLANGALEPFLGPEWEKLRVLTTPTPHLSAS